MDAGDQSSLMQGSNEQYAIVRCHDGCEDLQISSRANEIVVGGSSRWRMRTWMAIVTVFTLLVAACSGGSTVSPEQSVSPPPSDERALPNVTNTPAGVTEDGRSSVSSSDELDEADEPLVDSNGDGEFRLGWLHDDAFVPESAHSSVAARYGPTSGDYDIGVYYCAEEGKISDSDLAEAVEVLNENVAPFFDTASTSELTIEFIPRIIVSPEQMKNELSWARVNLRYLQENLAGREENPCLIDAYRHALTPTYLVLADMPGSGGAENGVAGYAWHYGGPAIVIAEEHLRTGDSRLDREYYLHTVAHELGHALLDLCHTHQTSRRTGDYGGECKLEESVGGIRYAPAAFQAYHDDYVYDPDDKSVMSYQFAMSPEEQRLYTFASDYINCRQLYITEFDMTDCRGAEVVYPNDVEVESPPEPEGSLPSPPADVVAAGFDGEILVKWSPPFDDGGAPLTGYRIEYSDGNVTEPLGSTSNHSYRIDGLRNGVEYTIGVRAENAVGISEAVNVVATPQIDDFIGTPPGPVVNLTATGGNRELSVNWSAPSDDGGAAITSYSVLYRITNGDWERWPHSGTSTSATIAGLAGGTQYVVEVTAQNIIEHGPSEYARASTREDQCTVSTGEHKHTPENSCHADHLWSATNPPPCLEGQTRDYTYHDPNDNDHHITRTVTACRDDPELSVRRGEVIVDDGSCPASAGCRWIVGSGSGWPAGEQFWIKCGNFVNTRENVPVPYRDRFVDAAGNLSWGQSICYSAGQATVEVWTQSGARKTVTIQATQSPPVAPAEPVDPELSVRRGEVIVDDGSCPASAGCRWIVGSGSGWPAGEQFWIKCGNFVNTRENVPVPYRDRFVDAAGNLSWGQSICYSAGQATVEVWTQSGARKTVTIQATQSPPVAPAEPVDPELSVRRGEVIVDDGSCPASAGCRWIVGSGSGWPAGEQFWIKCGNFVNTRENVPVPYRDRFVDAAGNLSWGQSICYSAGQATVEVWTQSGARKTVTIPG